MRCGSARLWNVNEQKYRALEEFYAEWFENRLFAFMKYEERVVKNTSWVAQRMEIEYVAVVLLHNNG